MSETVVTYLDLLCESERGDKTWEEAVNYGRRIVGRMTSNKWQVGDLLCLVFPYEDYDAADPHARSRAGRGERRVIQFAADIGITPQQATRYWQTSGVWQDPIRRMDVSWSTYLEGVTIANRPILARLLDHYAAGRGPKPTVDLIRKIRGQGPASEHKRTQIKDIDAHARIRKASTVVEEIAHKHPTLKPSIDRALAALSDLAANVTAIESQTRTSSHGV
jgi:hypothetical protein